MSPHYVKVKRFYSKPEKIPSLGEVQVMISQIRIMLPKLSYHEVIACAVEKWHNSLVAKFVDKQYDTVQALISQKFKCYYCEAPIHERQATIDHKTPKSRGGTNDHENLCMSCVPCNNLKGSMNEKEFIYFLKGQ